MAPELVGALYAAAHVAALLAAFVGYYGVVWLFFCACMGLDRQLHAGPMFLRADLMPPALAAIYPQGYMVPGGLPKPALYVGKAWLAVGMAANFIGNLGFTFVFLELPREAAITVRITRWVEHMPPSRRQRFAVWFRKTWLDGLDRRGIHRA